MSRSVWPTLIVLSYAGCVAGVRLARPFFLDDPVMQLVVFAACPGLLTLLTGALRRPLGVLVALLAPVLWLYVVSRLDDPAWLWAVPLFCGGLLLTVARVAQDRPLPRAVTLAAAAIALAVTVLPAPGRPTGKPRVVLIGVEGISSGSMEAHLAAGRLPHWARLQRTGRRARLVQPAAVDPHRIWCAIASGVAPEGGDARDRSQPAACRAGRIWDQAQRAGLAVGVCGWPGPQPAPADLGPGDFVLAEPCLPNGWLDAVGRGARLSTLRLMLAGRIARGRRHLAVSGERSPDRRLAWAFQSDVCAELFRARRPDFASVLFALSGSDGPPGHGAGADLAGGAAANTAASRAAAGDLCEAFDRSLGKLVAATPVGAGVVIVSLPGGLRPGAGAVDGIYLRCGPGAGSVTPADSAGVLDIAPSIAALLGLPAPPWPPPGYTGIQ